jgi:hypothetical protein
MTEINYSLLSEIIFANDNIFTDIHIKKAKMITYLCKAARENKNIKISYDRARAAKYCRLVTFISTKKTEKEVWKKDIDEIERSVDLNITDNYKNKIHNIITRLLKENNDVIEYVKDGLVKEQLRNKNRFIKTLKKILSIINNMGIDLNNLQVGDRDLCDDNDEYVNEKYNRVERVTIYKYNTYFINLLNNRSRENYIIEYISSEDYDDNWYRQPLIFT